MKLNPKIGVALACAAVLSLGACGKKNEDATMGQKLDSAIAKTGEAAQEVKADMKEAAADAKAGVQDGSEKLAVKIHDATITAEVNAGLARDPDLSMLKINVDTLEGKVTLKGVAPSDLARDRAGSIARMVSGVSAVDNQLVVKVG